MEGASSQTGSTDDNQPRIDGMSQKDQKLLFRIIQDEKASNILKTMARDVLRRHGVTVTDDGSNEPGTQGAELSSEQSVVPLASAWTSNAHQFQFQMLQSAHFHMPIAADSERINQLLPGSGIEIDTPSYYPQYPMPNTYSIENFRRLSVETLFYLFYYYDGTYAQQMAAEVLKENSWAFHTKYLMWFKRLMDPFFQTNDFEMGTFAYFDIEQWKEATKVGFVFEYRYLENGGLS